MKDALADITDWKADVTRSTRQQRCPPEKRGLKDNDTNHLVYLRWHNRSPQEVLAPLRIAREEWFSDREGRTEWPYNLEG